MTCQNCAVPYPCGEPLNEEVIRTFQQHFDITIRDGYGQTESTLIIAALKDQPIRVGSMGQSIAPGIVEVINEEGRSRFLRVLSAISPCI